MEAFHAHYSDRDHLTVAIEVPSDKIEYNSLPPLQKIQITHRGKLEIQKVKVYNKKENKLMDGTFSLRFQKIEPGKTTFAVNNETPQFNHKTQSGLPLVISAGLKSNCGYVSTIVVVKLDLNGNYLPDTAVDFAGYEYTITYTGYRKNAVGVLPEVLFRMSTTVAPLVTPTGSALQVQLSDVPITGGTYRLQIGGEFLKVRWGAYTENIPFDIEGFAIAEYLDAQFNCNARFF